MIQKENQKFVTSNVFEGMTSISAILNSPLALRRQIQEVWFDSAKKKSKSAELRFLIAKSHECGFPILFKSAQDIDAASIGSTHGGILAFCSNREIPTLMADAISQNGFYVYLEGVEDPYNFGYTIRSLYAANVDGIVLPERNWMHAAGIVARASAGTSELMPLFTADAELLSNVFHQCGYQIICAGIRDSVSLYQADLRFPILLVIGGEKRGISRNLLNCADQIVRIDYGREFRGSLSASSAATVMAFEILRQNRS